MDMHAAVVTARLGLHARSQAAAASELALSAAAYRARLSPELHGLEQRSGVALRSPQRSYTHLTLRLLLAHRLHGSLNRRVTAFSASSERSARPAATSRMLPFWVL